jgi:2-hydroxy-3-keto-5-methylthiopentenyl-1-phosphate phosphatase
MKLIQVEIEIADEKLWIALNRLSSYFGIRKSEIVDEITTISVEKHLKALVKNLATENAEFAEFPEIKEFLNEYRD